MASYCGYRNAHLTENSSEKSSLRLHRHWPSCADLGNAFQDVVSEQGTQSATLSLCIISLEIHLHAHKLQLGWGGSCPGAFPVSVKH